ncbi:MAG: hypothetical protein LRY71_03485 [Bacillaceae bacterium]|nr:hypothetical protein [Bacillaceae bacterium]
MTFIKSSSIEHQLKTMKDKIVQLKPKALVVIGGDGTIHYCLSILVESSIPLAVIPAGSGNDFARALHIPKSTKKAFQRVLNGNTKKIDVMSVNNELCVTVLGVGLDAMVANVVQNSQIKKSAKSCPSREICVYFRFV